MAKSTSNDKSNLEWLNELPEKERIDLIKKADKDKLLWHNSCLEHALIDLRGQNFETKNGIVPENFAG